MAKYSGKNATKTGKTLKRAPIETKPNKRTVGYEGGDTPVRKSKGELFTLAVSFMGADEPTFYETGGDRQARFVALIHKVTKKDPAWMQEFVPWLRDYAFMRTASIVTLVEYARAGGPAADLLIGRTLRRADEPAELLGYYWETNGGRKTIAEPIKRGLAYSARTLYNEFNVLKYDGVSHNIRFGDVVELTHPAPFTLRSIASVATERGVELETVVEAVRKARVESQEYAEAFVMAPGALPGWGLNAAAFALGFENVEELTEALKVEWQTELFRYVLDRRHHPDDIRADLSRLPLIAANRRMREDVAPEDRRQFLRAYGYEALRKAGMTWESLSEWLPGGMDAEAWEWAIPNMAYMALLRNLRNFDQAGVSDEVAQSIIARLTDPTEVERSMQFPYRFYSAYKNVTTNRWAQVLDTAIGFSTQNIPALPGRSLVLIDVSGSMGATISEKSQMRNYEAAAVFGVCQYRAAGFSGDLVAFGTGNRKVPLTPGTSVLKGVEAVEQIFSKGNLGYGTNMWEAFEDHFDGHDRIMIFTDEQAHDHFRRADVLKKLNGQPVYFWNLSGYRPAAADFGTPGRYEMAGLSDASFRQIALLERGLDAGWPWET